MKLRLTARFVRDYGKAPRQVQSAFDKQSEFLLQNLQHPSSRAKKYDEARGIWQARVTRDWRFYFLIQGDTYQLIRLMAHPK